MESQDQRFDSYSYAIWNISHLYILSEKKYLDINNFEIDEIGMFRE